MAYVGHQYGTSKLKHCDVYTVIKLQMLLGAVEIHMWKMRMTFSCYTYQFVSKLWAAGLV